MHLTLFIQRFCDRLTNCRPTVRRPVPRRRQQSAPAVEGLENRTLLSVNAVFNAETGALDVTTTKNSKIHIDIKKGQVAVNGHIVQTGASSAANVRSAGLTADDIAILNISGSDGRNKIDLSDVHAGTFSTLSAVNVNAGGGDDKVIGSDLDDSIVGGSGDDDLNGGSGDDFIQGGSGNDDVNGDDGDDDCLGGVGDDSVHGGSGNDDCDGEDGDDDVSGDDGDDHCRGGSGNDDIRGGTGIDDLHGDDGDDTLHNEDDLDSEDGGSGHDSDDDISDDHGGDNPGSDDPPGDDHGGGNDGLASLARTAAVPRKHGADDGPRHEPRHHERHHRPNHK